MPKDARYFKHDSNARSDPKIRALINKYGVEGYGRFWIIIELLRESDGYKFNDKSYVWQTLAEEFKCEAEEAKSFVEDLSSSFELLEKDNGCYYSMPFLSRMQVLDDLRNKRVKAGKARHGIDWDV